MNQDQLNIRCSELLEMAEENPAEIEVIVDMLIEAESDLCEGLLAA